MQYCWCESDVSHGNDNINDNINANDNDNDNDADNDVNDGTGDNNDLWFKRQSHVISKQYISNGYLRGWNRHM